jgi:hypothetical protein
VQNPHHGRIVEEVKKAGLCLDRARAFAWAEKKCKDYNADPIQVAIRDMTKKPPADCKCYGDSIADKIMGGFQPGPVLDQTIIESCRK